MKPERVEPHSLQAEQAVLGTLLIRSDLFEVLPSALRPESFYRDAHTKIFEAMQALRERGVAIDLVTVNDEIKRRGHADAVGGAAYLASLSDGVPRSTNASHYAEIVTEHALRRAVIRLAKTLIADAYEQQGRDVLAGAQKEVIRLSSELGGAKAEALPDILSRLHSEIERWHTAQTVVFGLATGFIELDNRLGGLQKGNLILLAARPSVGKTSLAINIAQNVAMAGGVVLVMSLEMTKDELTLRMLSGESGISARDIRSGHLSGSDYDKLANAMSKLHATQVVIDDTAAAFVEDVAILARKVRLQYGRLDLIVVDYLQLHRTRQKFDNRTNQVSIFSGTLKATAKDLDVPVLALSQLSRASETAHRRPQLSDLRESGSLEQDADVVVFIHRTLDADDGTADIIIGKQRNGPVGSFRMAFLKDTTTFADLTEQ